MRKYGEKIMKNCLIYIAICCSLCNINSSYAQEPEEKPRISKGILDAVTPELYEINIYLKGGEIVKITKVALTKVSLEKRIVSRVLDKTIRVIPDGTKEIKVIKSFEIEKVEIIKMKDKPKVDPKTVPAIL